LRGRQLIHMRGRESLEDAVRHLERSLRLDANYAPAHAQLAIATTLLLNSVGTYGTLSKEEVNRRAIPHIERALELAPNLADVHGAMGLLALHGADPLETIDHASRAVALNPSYVDAMNWLQIAYGQLGQYREVTDIMLRMLEIDPLSTIGRMNYGGLLLFKDDVEAAHANANQLMQQNLWAGYTNHANAALQDGRLSDSLSWNLRAYSEDPGDPFSNLLLVATLNFVSEFNEARRVSDTFQFLVDYYEGKNEEAARNTQRRLELDPSNFDALVFAADTMYLTRNFAEAESLYVQLRDYRPAGRTIGDSVLSTIAFAAVLRARGDLIAAQANIEIAADEIESLIEQGWDDLYRYEAQALMAAYDDDIEATAAALQTALDRGSRDPMFINRPLFDGMRDDERLSDYHDEISRFLEEERAKTKQMMCFENPVPDAWQPLAETCQGVIRETI
jgi:tetratricopeptide (TPR) repeat protein